jgi:hypothetical protein
MHIYPHVHSHKYTRLGNNHLLIRLAWHTQRAAGEKYICERTVIYTRLLLALFLCVLDFNWVDVFIYQRRLGIRSCRFYVFDADGRIGSLKWKLWENIYIIKTPDLYVDF